MQYHSTRGLAPEADSAAAVLQGIAPDGGLYMPRRIPAFDWKGCVAARPMNALATVSRPFVALLTFSTSTLLRLLGMKHTTHWFSEEK